MDVNELLTRLESAHPGWDEYDALIKKIKSLKWKIINDEHLGRYFISHGVELVFKLDVDNSKWPKWAPPYVFPLRGLIAYEYDLAGGYADWFTGEPSVSGSVFVGAVEDSVISYPYIEAPEGVYNFQANSSGALFHLSKTLNVLYPDIVSLQFEQLDTLESFTKNCISKSLEGEVWYSAYQDRGLQIFD